MIELLDWDTALFFLFLFDNPFFDTEISKTGSGYGVILFNYVLNLFACVCVDGGGGVFYKLQY